MLSSKIQAITELNQQIRKCRNTQENIYLGMVGVVIVTIVAPTIITVFGCVALCALGGMYIHDQKQREQQLNTMLNKLVVKHERNQKSYNYE